MFQLNLFKRKTAAQALELASWLRIEISTLRSAIEAMAKKLKNYEKTLVKLEEMITDLKQQELFDEEPKKRSKK